jgi:hypothetical protein
MIEHSESSRTPSRSLLLCCRPCSHISRNTIQNAKSGRNGNGEKNRKESPKKPSKTKEIVKVEEKEAPAPERERRRNTELAPYDYVNPWRDFDRSFDRFRNDLEVPFWPIRPFPRVRFPRMFSTGSVVPRMVPRMDLEDRGIAFQWLLVCRGLLFGSYTESHGRNKLLSGGLWRVEHEKAGVKLAKNRLSRFLSMFKSWAHRRLNRDFLCLGQCRRSSDNLL